MNKANGKNIFILNRSSLTHRKDEIEKLQIANQFYFRTENASKVGSEDAIPKCAPKNHIFYLKMHKCASSSLQVTEFYLQNHLTA